MKALERLKFMVQLVTGVRVDEDGGFTAKEADGKDLDGTVGYHFGFYSRPVDDARGAVLKADGRGNVSFLFCFRDKQYELSLQQGEVGVQNAFGASTLWDKDGNVIIKTPAATVKVGADGTVEIGSDTGLTAILNGVVLASGVDTFTGATYGALGNASSVVLAKKA